MSLSRTVLAAATAFAMVRARHTGARARLATGPGLDATSGSPGAARSPGRFLAHFLPRSLARSLVERASSWPAVARLVARRRHRDERAAFDRQVAMAAELVRTGLSAGLSPVQAIQAAGPLLPDPSRSALLGVARGLRLGLGLAEAVAPLRSYGETATAMADALVVSSALGTEADGVLARLALDARTRSRQQAETRARTAPVRLLFPLVLCVLPAFALLAIAPPLLTDFGP